MKLFLVLASLSLASPVFAGPQQEKMKECNAQAKGKKGDERKAFMKSCLSGGATAAAEAAPAKAADPKQRMKDCNAQAKGKKGQERKDFMSTCLKNAASGSPAAEAPAAAPAPVEPAKH